MGVGVDAGARERRRFVRGAFAALKSLKDAFATSGSPKGPFGASPWRGNRLGEGAIAAGASVGMCQQARS
ncbi:hypothetical protein GCM10009754_42880 [Amycolatopsis minnesotensis]|uniref:Uncharacterized protein n=1 Tax=Amycolatopsis minnesotensis TaxID=337894 RepID=A0ABP5CM36_9PSEU